MITMGEIIKLPTAQEALRRAWAEMTTPDGEAFRASVFVDIARELREGTAVKPAALNQAGPDAAMLNARKIVELETELGELRAKLRSRERSDDVRRNEGSLSALPSQVAAAVRDAEADPKLWTATAEPGERFPAPDQTARMPRDFFVSPQIGVPAQRPLSDELSATIKAQLAQPVPFAPQLDTPESECVFCDGAIYQATVYQANPTIKSWRHRETGLVICPVQDADRPGETHYAAPTS